MTIGAIIIFIFILFLLILAHEWGHFVTAKRFGIRVEEFGIGFPPRAKKLFTKDGTDYTLNWLPIGGFVKIFGENYEDQSESAPLAYDSFAAKAKWKQAIVLFAGVFMNFILAGILFSITFMMGSPFATESISPRALERMEESIVILDVVPNSPADLAGIVRGDKILRYSYGATTVEHPTVESFVETTAVEDSIDITYEHNGDIVSATVEPLILEGSEGNRQLVGVTPIMLASGGDFGFFESITYGFESAVVSSRDTLHMIGKLFAKGEEGTVARGSVSGPVGIVAITPVILAIGFGCLLSFIGVISISLAIINLVPFPALDGGRLLFVLIESITGRPLPAKFFNWANTIGFFILIGLMLLITVRDVVHLF